MAFVLKASAMATLMIPFGLYSLYCWVVNDIGAEPTPFPKPWLALGIGSGISFVAGFTCACPMLVIVGRLRRFCRNSRLTSGM